MKEALESELGLFPGHAQASVVLQPRDGALDSPTPFVATQSTAVLRDTSVGSVGRDKFDVLQGEFSSKASLSWALDDSFGQLGDEHEAEEFLDQAASCGLAGAVLTANGSPLASTKIMIFTPFPALVQPIPTPPPLALAKVPSTKHS